MGPSIQPACRYSGRRYRAARERPGSTGYRRSIPFKGPLLPLVNESDRQDTEEHHHGDEAEPAEVPERDGPGEQECHFEVENDEKDGDEVEPHVELHAGIVEGIETALVGRQLLGIGTAVGNDERSHEQRDPDQERYADEDYERQVVGEEIRHTTPRRYGARRRAGNLKRI